MGRVIDLDKPFTDEDKEFLTSRGRGYLIPANERRFGEDGKGKPESHEKAGSPPENPFFDAGERDQAVYDVSGAPLPGTVIDKDSGCALDRESGEIIEHNTGYDLDADAGRVAERDNGVEFDPVVPQNRPGQFSNSLEGFVSRSDDDDDIDEDIVEEVCAMSVSDLKAKLAKAKEPTTGKKEELQDRLAIHLQDKRDGKV